MYTAYAYDVSKTHHDNVYVSLRVQRVSHPIASPPTRASSSPIASSPLSPPRSIARAHLTVVLVQPRVHGVDDVRTNRGQENFRQGARRAVAALDGDHGKRGRHDVSLERVGKRRWEARATARRGRRARGHWASYPGVKVVTLRVQNTRFVYEMHHVSVCVCVCITYPSLLGVKVVTVRVKTRLLCMKTTVHVSVGTCRSVAVSTPIDESTRRGRSAKTSPPTRSRIRSSGVHRGPTVVSS